MRGPCLRLLVIQGTFLRIQFLQGRSSLKAWCFSWSQDAFYEAEGCLWRGTQPAGTGTAAREEEPSICNPISINSMTKRSAQAQIIMLIVIVKMIIDERSIKRKERGCGSCWRSVMSAVLAPGWPGCGVCGLWRGLFRPLAPGRPSPSGGGVGRVRGGGKPAKPRKPAQDHVPTLSRDTHAHLRGSGGEGRAPDGISLTPTPPGAPWHPAGQRCQSLR
jgi:hypothetical protein